MNETVSGMTSMQTGGPQPSPDLMTVVVLGDLEATLNAHDPGEIEAALLEFVGGQRWYSGKSAGLARAEFIVLGMPAPREPWHVLTEAVMRTASGQQRYLLPLSARWGAPNAAGDRRDLPYTLMKIQEGATLGVIVDGTRDTGFVKIFVDMIAAGATVDLGAGRLEFTRSETAMALVTAAAAVPAAGIVPIGGEQSNTSVLIGRPAVLKFYRQLRDGIQPELEVTRFLTERTAFAGAPALLGSVELVRQDGTRAAVAALFERIENRGDAWTVVTEGLAQDFRDDATATQPPADELVDAARPRSGVPSKILADVGQVIGRRTGEMHAALATRTGDADFDPEPIYAKAVGEFVEAARREARQALDVLDRIDRAGAEGPGGDIDRLLAGRNAIFGWFERFGEVPVASHRTRIHGDYHLGQLLVTGNDIVILDFEGEPGASLEERRTKSSPLRDVAGMLRSFDYAAFAALDKVGAGSEATIVKLRDRAEAWRADVCRSFLDAWSVASGVDVKEESAERLLDLFLLQKAFYELRYEAAMRPGWLSIPLRGIISLLEKRQVLS